MKSWAWGAMVMAVFALGACKKSTSTTTSSTTGSGGDTGAGGSSSSTNAGGSTGSTTVTVGSGGSSSSTNSGGSSGVGGSASACDNTGVCQDQDMDSTNDCISCALADACSGQLQACGSDMDCCTPQADGSCGTDSFVGCIGVCAQGDQACFDKCGTDHPTGAGLYNELVICAICDNCPVDCDGPGSGCP